MLLIISGCSKREEVNYNYIFKGENEKWSADYRIDGIGVFTERNGRTEYENNVTKLFTITYKKDLSELASVKHMEISYKGIGEKGSMKTDFNDGSPTEKTYRMKSGGWGVAINLNKDQVIEVTVNLDGKIETIELKNEN
jgi:hypothetical protein